MDQNDLQSTVEIKEGCALGSYNGINSSFNMHYGTQRVQFVNCKIVYAVALFSNTKNPYDMEKWSRPNYKHI